MNKILDKLFGHKYYAIIVDYMGYDSLSAEVYTTKKAADEAASKLQENRSQYQLHVISFRSRRVLLPEVIQHYVQYHS